MHTSASPASVLLLLRTWSVAAVAAVLLLSNPVGGEHAHTHYTAEPGLCCCVVCVCVPKCRYLRRRFVRKACTVLNARVYYARKLRMFGRKLVRPSNKIGNPDFAFFRKRSSPVSRNRQNTHRYTTYAETFYVWKLEENTSKTSCTILFLLFGLDAVCPFDVSLGCTHTAQGRALRSPHPSFCSRPWQHWCCLQKKAAAAQPWMWMLPVASRKRGRDQKPALRHRRFEPRTKGGPAACD